MATVATGIAAFCIAFVALCTVALSL
jgi:hypothetical protein